jgi:predicted polyphosphate/ATP-dependent NAD kinase
MAEMTRRKESRQAKASCDKTFIQILAYPNTMATIAFIINPIAGMGGKVGLKGTDGIEILEQARKLSAEPIAYSRALETIKTIFEKKPDVKWLTCSKDMGEEALKEAGYNGKEDYTIVYETPNTTTAEDTKKACKKFKEMKVEMIIFCGGDGTARDISSVIGKEIPIIGIPAGVKMYSAVFGINPRSTAEVLFGYLKGEYGVTEAEIMDIDEESYRQGELHAKLFGYALVPLEKALVQTGKAVFESMDDEAAKDEIAKFVAEIMGEEKDTMFILGAGSTVERIGKELNIEKTILGVDVVRNGELIGKDVNEAELLELLGEGDKATIIIGVIGSQGFVFGRGSQQISPKVIRKVGVENIRIVATPNKLSQTSRLMVDTGDEELDKMLSGFHKIIIGYHEMRMTRLEIGGA